MVAMIGLLINQAEEDGVLPRPIDASRLDEESGRFTRHWRREDPVGLPQDDDSPQGVQQAEVFELQEDGIMMTAGDHQGGDHRGEDQVPPPRCIWQGIAG